MKIVLDRMKFLRALKIVSMAAAKNNKNGIHPDAVLISVNEDNQVRLVCSRIDYSIIARMPAEAVDSPGAGSIGIEARRLLNMVAVCSGERVSLITSDKPYGPLMIEDDRYRFRVLPIDPENLYAITVKDRDCTISAPGLLKTARRVLFAASDEDARPVLQAVEFNSHVTATDGFRIVSCASSYEGVQGLIPANLLRLASRIFKSGDPMIWTDAERFALSDGQVTLETVQIQGNFPDYKVIIPRKFQLRIGLPSADFLRALNALCTVCESSIIGSKSHILAISMTPEEDHLKVVLRNKPEEVAFEACLSADLLHVADGFEWPFEIALNGDLLVDAIKQTGDRMIMAFNACNTPVLIRPADETDPWLAVIMPMHLG